MNHPFVKMLRFEWKSNYAEWIFYFLISIALPILLKGINPYIFLPFYIFIGFVFTINSYKESITKQSMQMYHLLPISGNLKFLSKQFITFFAFPITLLFLVLIYTILTKAWDTNAPYVFISDVSHPTLLLGIIWIFGHSVCTFFAIAFKKNKILYAFLAYFGFRLLMSVLALTIFSIFGIDPGANFFKNLAKHDIDFVGVTALLFFSAVFYSISYRLFFRRQL